MVCTMEIEVRRTEDTLQQLLNHWYLKDHQDGKGEEDYLLGVRACSKKCEI